MRTHEKIGAKILMSPCSVPFFIILSDNSKRLFRPCTCVQKNVQMETNAIFALTQITNGEPMIYIMIIGD